MPGNKKSRAVAAFVLKIICLWVLRVPIRGAALQAIQRPGLPLPESRYF